MPSDRTTLNLNDPSTRHLLRLLRRARPYIALHEPAGTRTFQDQYWLVRQIDDLFGPPQLNWEDDEEE